jgi:predicted lipoprotein with Yx(FWY)xxD motif
MSKRSIWIVIIVAVIVIAGGVTAYMVSHSTSTSKTSTSTNKSAAAVIIQTKSSSSVGNYLADENGSPLYTYGKDTSGVSNCNGTCLLGWPVYAPTSSTTSLPTNLTIITRSDNTKQYAYNGSPLYTFSGDVNGNVNGDGVSGFSVAKP